MTQEFHDLGVPADLVSVLLDTGIATPFPIQQLTLPDTLAGRDLCGRAPTGSGKTLAFALPVAARVGRGEPNRPRALVLVPTRELAAQVRDTLEPFTKVRRRRTATFYGGTSIRADQQRLRGGVDVAVATPGRLADLVKRGDIHLDDVDLVVLDEADRMADMGFLPEVRRLLDATSADRQTLLFSATLDGDVDVLVRRYQRDPVRREFHLPEEQVGDVRHVFFPAERAEKRRLTKEVLDGRGSAIVFTRTKHGADRLAKQLSQDGVLTAAIHGNRSQNQREAALQRFRTRQVTALIATDVAARGLHIDAVDMVVHYDLPATHKDYIHRSGRTGRAGSRGLVVTLVSEEQLSDLDSIQREAQLDRGLHARDLALLDREELPPVEVSASHPRRSTSTSARAGGQRRQRARGRRRRTASSRA